MYNSEIETYFISAANTNLSNSSGKHMEITLMVYGGISQSVQVQRSTHIKSEKEMEMGRRETLNILNR